MNDMQEGIMHFTKWQACGNDFVFVNAMTMDIRPVVKNVFLFVTEILV